MASLITSQKVQRSSLAEQIEALGPWFLREETATPPDGPHVVYPARGLPG